MGQDDRLATLSAEKFSAYVASAKRLEVLLYAACLVILVAVGFAAAEISALFAFGAVVVTALAIVPIGFNWVFPAMDRRIRPTQDQTYLFSSCSSGLVGRFRWANRRIPSNPRCRICLIPFGGIGKWLRVIPSRKNPNFCRSCFEAAPEGGYETEVGVFFADIRGFTTWCEERSPAEVAEGLKYFYDLTSDVLTVDDAMIELVGDQVMALYLPLFASLGERTADTMLAAAERLLKRLGDEKSKHGLAVGIGIHIGNGFVGNVGKGETKDFTAVGDVVNTAARLQSRAEAGEIVISDEVFSRISRHDINALPQSLSVKGKAEPIQAHVLRAG